MRKHLAVVAALLLLRKKGTALSAELSDLKQSYGAGGGPAAGATGIRVGVYQTPAEEGGGG